MTNEFNLVRFVVSEYNLEANPKEILCRQVSEGRFEYMHKPYYKKRAKRVRVFKSNCFETMKQAVNYQLELMQKNLRQAEERVNYWQKQIESQKRLIESLPDRNVTNENTSF